MIKTIENSNLITHYSDEGKYIRQIETGIIYNSATDVIPCRYTYEETDESYEIPLEEIAERLGDIL